MEGDGDGRLFDEASPFLLLVLVIRSHFSPIA